MPGYENLETVDAYPMYAGAMDRYDWKLVGKQELYVPYNSYKWVAKGQKYKDVYKDDFVNRDLQYAGVQAVYNWNCCGLSLGYRRFALGSVRDETQYLYSFTIANFGSVGDIRRSNTVFHDANLLPAY